VSQHQLKWFTTAKQTSLCH